MRIHANDANLQRAILYFAILLLLSIMVVFMAGHSKWKKVKYKKEASDQKRGKIFSKLLNAISIAARKESNPQFNPTLRAAIDQAKEALVPSDKIESAISRAHLAAENLEELLFEAYGPEGAALLIEVISDSRNRSVSEIKKILTDHGAKWAEPGSVQWVFVKTQINPPSLIQASEGHAQMNADDTIPAHGKRWRAKFPQEISPDGKEKLHALVEALEEHDDVQHVIANVTM